MIFMPYFSKINFSGALDTVVYIVGSRTIIKNDDVSRLPVTENEVAVFSSL